jgi:oligopeptide/dipeptide ABC transporter ATP-binding protein
VSTAPILDVRDLRKKFPVRRSFGRTKHWLRAIDGVDFALNEGEVLGLVGESGCGKSTLGKTIMGIHRPDFGSIRFKGQELVGLSKSQYLRVRSQLQYVYQDAGAALDPRWKIRNSLDEAMVIHADITRDERHERVVRTLRAVGLRPEHMELFPHELSGGQQRRASLARILTLHPKLLILDEPTSGLDVSVQATILKLLRGLQAEFNLTYLFISHDLAVVRLMCHRVAVMYLGKIVETAPTEILFQNPRHPYTRSLLAAIPQPGVSRITDSFTLAGEPPDPVKLPSGCRFRTRCVLAADLCAREEPVSREFGPARAAACHFA